MPRMSKSKEQQQLMAIATAAALSGAGEREAAEHILMNELATATTRSMRTALLRVFVMVSSTPALAFLGALQLVTEFGDDPEHWFSLGAAAGACGNEALREQANRKGEQLRTKSLRARRRR